VFWLVIALRIVLFLRNSTSPLKMKNLYSEPSCGVTLAKLKAELTRLRTELDDRDQFSNIQ
jgi:hypothetical protein